MMKSLIKSKGYLLELLSLALLGALLSLISFPTLASAGPINFQLKSYGGTRAVIIFNGDGAAELGAALDPSGTSVRVSAIGGGFAANSEIPKKGLIAYVQQVSRSGYEDLVITLSRTATLTESRSENSLKLFISATSEPIPTATDTKTDSGPTVPTASQAVPAAVSLPVRFFTKGVPTEKNQLVVAFPEFSSTTDPAIVATLRGVSYFAGLMSDWLTSKDFKIQRPDETRSTEETDELIDALTAEVVELRKQLNSSEQELKKRDAGLTQELSN